MPHVEPSLGPAGDIMIKFTQSGSFGRTEAFLKRNKNQSAIIQKIVLKHADAGLEALKLLTPKDSGFTAEKWTYKLTKNGISYENSSVVNGHHVVILLQYGHATKNGGYVQAIDFINPALRPIFDQISLDCWKEVTSV